MNKIMANGMIDLHSESWTEANQENLDSLLVAAEMFNYKVHIFYGVTTSLRSAHKTFSFVEKGNKNEFNLSFSHDNKNIVSEIIVIEFFPGPMGGHTKYHFSKNYDKAINYAKKLL